MSNPRAMSEALASQMAAVTVLYKQKKWQETVQAYQAIIEQYGGKAPVEAFAQLAVAFRRIKRFDDCENNLRVGLGHYPAHRSLIAEQAVLEMQRLDWTKAAERWATYYEGGKCSERNYNRYAHTLEKLGWWDEHEALVLRGMAKFPFDIGLADRLVYNSAHRDEAVNNWKSASRKYSFLAKRVPPTWPFALRYRVKEAEIQAKLAQLPSTTQKLECIRSSQLNVSGHVWPEVAAGTVAFMDLAAGRAPTDGKLRTAVAALMEFYRDTDLDLKSLRGMPKYDALVAELNRSATPEALVDFQAPTSIYKFLSRALLRHGYVKGYWLLRARYVDGLIERRNSVYSETSGQSSGTNPLKKDWFKADLIDFTDQLGLANELGDRDYFEFLNAVHAPGGTTDMIVQAVSRLYHYDAPLYPGINPPTNEPEFERLLSGKSVAVVGPVDVGLESGAEIEGYDIVVRFNHRKVLSNDPSRFGSRTNISYYIHTGLSKTKDQTIIDSMNMLDFTVVDKWCHGKAPWLSEVRSPIRLRLKAWQHTINPFLFGCPNGIQRVVMDLLRFNVRKLKIFNSNLFLDANYSGGYRKKLTNPFPGLSLHDPICNLVFLQRAYKNGHFEVDNRLAEVLAMTPLAYVEALEEIYRPQEIFGRS